MVRLIDRIHQTSLFTAEQKNITDGEMTSFSKLVLQSKEPGQEAMPECKWQMSDGRMDRSDPLDDKRYYGRTTILPMVKYSYGMEMGRRVIVIYALEY